MEKTVRFRSLNFGRSIHSRVVGSLFELRSTSICMGLFVLLDVGGDFGVDVAQFFMRS
jgi:hypothetical protein